MSPAPGLASPEAVTLVTYLWHYLVARLIYDELLRPAVHARPAALLAALASLVLLVYLARRRRSAGRRG